MIEHEAKKIMDDFIDALEEIDESELSIGVERKKQLREKAEEKKDPEFSELFIKNTPHGEQNNLIVSEKKKW